MDFKKSHLLTTLILAFVLLAGCAGPTTTRPVSDDAAVALEAQKQREFAVKELIRNQQRLYQVGWPILVSGLPLCVDRNRWAIGAFYANKFDFPKEMQDTAISSLGMSDVLTIHTLIDGAPAVNSGLKEGAVLFRVNDKQVPTGEGASKKFTEVLNEELKDGKDITFVVKQDGIEESFNISPVKICDYPLIVINQDDVNAYADGNNIVIFQGMMDFAKTDEELAMVVAHELAHNNMRHIEAKKTNFFLGFLADILVIGLTGVDVGIRNAAAGAYSKDFESEADYVGMYIMARAGMGLDNAPDFWRRMGSRNPKSIEDNYLASHPSTPERFVALGETIKEIQQKQASAQDLMPNVDEEARSSREPPPSQASQLGLTK